MFRLKPKSSLVMALSLPAALDQEHRLLYASSRILKALWVSVVGVDKSFSLGHPPTERWLKTEGKEGPEGRRTSKGMTESAPREVGMLENQMVPRWVRK